MNNENVNQEQQVIEYLKNNKSLTQKEANILLSVGRLAARIYTLIHRDGYPIKKNMITVINQFGKKTCVAEYSCEFDTIEVDNDR